MNPISLAVSVVLYIVGGITVVHDYAREEGHTSKTHAVVNFLIWPIPMMVMVALYLVEVIVDLVVWVSGGEDDGPYAT